MVSADGAECDRDGIGPTSNRRAMSPFGDGKYCRYRPVTGTGHIFPIRCFLVVSEFPLESDLTRKDFPRPNFALGI